MAERRTRGGSRVLTALLDEAWARVPPAQRRDFDGVVTMNRQVGIAPHQTSVRLVVGAAGEVITAFPETAAAAARRR